MSPSRPDHGSGRTPGGAPAELTASLPLLDVVFGALETGMLLAMTSGRIVSVNDALSTMLGPSRDEILAMGVPVFLDHLASLSDEPPDLLIERRLMPVAERVVCEEIAIQRPARAVLRWVAHAVELAGQPAHLVCCTDVTSEVDLASVQERFALTDRLTNLMNRRGADSVLEREAARVRRHGAAVSVVLFDVDHFKRVNDAFGHGAGDEALRRVASAIVGGLRGGDVAARWGGEEFIVVLPETPLEGALVCADRIRTAVAAQPIPSGHVTISGGAAQLVAGEVVNTTIARADDRLYAAKVAGRNQVC